MRHRLPVIAASCLLLLCFAPAAAPDQSPKKPSESDADKVNAERRLEVERLRRVLWEEERREYARMRNHPSDNTYYRPYPWLVLAETVCEAAAPTPVVEPKPCTSTCSPRRNSSSPRSYVGVVFAPGSGSRKPAVGLQYLSTRNYGVALWGSGTLFEDDDVIPAPIPHDDYYTEISTGSYGVEALICTGSDQAMLVFGAGISVNRTIYTDISRATGWKWDGGATNKIKPAAMVGCRLRVGNRVSLQLGYDTSQSAFFGLSAGF